MTRSRQWIVLSLLLMTIGGLVFAYKAVMLGYPVLPDQAGEQWVVQLRLEIEPEAGPVLASIMLPARPAGFTISEENFVSRGFGLTLEEDVFRRQADWAIRSLSAPKTLYYRATVISDLRQRRLAGKPEMPSMPQLEEPWARCARSACVSASSRNSLTFASASRLPR